MRAKVISSIFVVAFYLYLLIGFVAQLPLEISNITVYEIVSVIITEALALIGIWLLCIITLKWLWKED